MQLLPLGSSPLPSALPQGSRCEVPLVGCKGVASSCCLVQGWGILHARVGVSGERWRRPSPSECGYRAFLRLIRSGRVLPGPGGSYCRLHGDESGFV